MQWCFRKLSMLKDFLYISLVKAQKEKNSTQKDCKMNLKHSQLEVDNWIKKHVRYFNELTNMAQLTEEVGEVARIIASLR
jgi:hypothetical protein